VNTELTEAQKLDILRSFSKEYNLKEVPDDPATYTMSCGKGYTLFASISRSWYFQFNDGTSTETYDIESSKVPFTYAGDARKLFGKYEEECGNVLKRLKNMDTETVESVNAEVVDDLEEKKRILEALENGEIRGPEPKTKQPVTRRERTDRVENVNPTFEPAQLPAPIGVGGIVRPAVTAAEALAAWQEFQQLKNYIIEASDIQKINGKNHVKKSGWRKFATFYNLTDQIVEETRDVLENGAFQWKMKVLCTAPNGRKTEGVAICTSTEKKFTHPEHDVYTTCHTRAKNRAISDMIAAGEVSAEEMEA